MHSFNKSSFNVLSYLESKLSRVFLISSVSLFRIDSNVLGLVKTKSFRMV